MNKTIADLATELDAPEGDVSALVDQLIELDGHEATVDDTGAVRPEAADVIRRQIRG